MDKCSFNSEERGRLIFTSPRVTNGASFERLEFPILAADLTRYKSRYLRLTSCMFSRQNPFSRSFFRTKFFLQHPAGNAFTFVWQKSNNTFFSVAPQHWLSCYAKRLPKANRNTDRTGTSEMIERVQSAKRMDAYRERKGRNGKMGSDSVSSVQGLLHGSK